MSNSNYKRNKFNISFVLSEIENSCKIFEYNEDFYDILQTFMTIIKNENYLTENVISILKINKIINNNEKTPKNNSK